MTRYAIDAAVALRIVRSGWTVPGTDRLVAPTWLKTDAMRIVYDCVLGGRLDDREGLRTLDELAALPIRLLADRVSRATAFRIARTLQLPDPLPAEYLAVAKLQSDTLVTDDPLLAGWASGIISVRSSADVLDERA